MLARLLHAGRKAHDLRLVEARRRQHRRDRGLALGQRAGLVDDERIDLLHALERLGVLDQHAGFGAAPDADHDRHGRREPERARAGDDEHRDRGDEGVGEARLRPPDAPGGEGEERDRDHGGHEPAGHRVGEALDRRAAALRLGDERHDAREHGVAADALGLDDERAACVQRAADDGVAGGLGDGHGFAGHHRFVDRAAALDDLAVDGDLLAWPHAQLVADHDLIERPLRARLRRARSGARSWARDRAARGWRRSSSRARAAPAPGRAAPAP